MKRSAIILVTSMLAACSAPSAGDEAMAELEVQMRAEARSVAAGEDLAAIFGDCTQDCAGHQAGYLWALDQPDLLHADDCPEPENHSFNHGCRMGVAAASFL